MDVLVLPKWKTELWPTWTLLWSTNILAKTSRFLLLWFHSNLNQTIRHLSKFNGKNSYWHIQSQSLQSKKVNQNNWVDNRKCRWFFQMDFTKSKTCSFENWVSRNKVRVPKIQATIGLMCSNAPDLKADSKSVRISEISQQMPEIATFLFQKGGEIAEK